MLEVTVPLKTEAQSDVIVILSQALVKQKHGRGFTKLPRSIDGEIFTPLH